MPAAAMKEMMKNSTQEEQKKGMAAWTKWMELNRASFVDVGAAAGRNTRVTKDDTKEIANDIGGYSVMQSTSKKALKDILKKSPHFDMPGAYVEVMELMEM